jgi:hypothetical protein
MLHCEHYHVFMRSWLCSYQPPGRGLSKTSSICTVSSQQGSVSCFWGSRAPCSQSSWLPKAHCPSSAILLVPLSSRPGTLHDFHSHEIAEQLTLLDAELFYKIEVCVEWPNMERQLCVPGSWSISAVCSISSYRFLRFYFGPKSRTRRRAPT